jgi:hypothetical protein
MSKQIDLSLAFDYLGKVRLMLIWNESLYTFAAA